MLFEGTYKSASELFLPPEPDLRGENGKKFCVMEPQIVAMGGGGFSAGSENLLLENYILGLANKASPKVCFVPTAGGDSEQYLLKFYASFAKLSATATHLPLFRLAVMTASRCGDPVSDASFPKDP
jgi:hypothetical protein